MASLADARVFLAADQADDRIRLFNPFAKDERKPTDGNKSLLATQPISAL